MPEKIVIVEHGGMVESVFAEKPDRFDVEILDFDTQDLDELHANEERLATVEQYLCEQEV